MEKYILSNSTILRDKNSLPVSVSEVEDAANDDISDEYEEEGANSTFTSFTTYDI